MKTLQTLTVGGISVAAVLAVAPPATAEAAARVPASSEVSVTQSVPNLLGATGSFRVRLALLQPVDVAGFYLYRYTSSTGVYRYLGQYSGTVTLDLASTAWGVAVYRALPYDRNGNVGDEVFSRAVYPRVLDESDGNTFLISGVGGRVAQSGAYQGDYFRTTSRGARVRFYTGNDYNNALVVSTGPSGGIGTVYFRGARMGTINFYSATPSHRKVVFNLRSSPPGQFYADIVQTGLGARGGVQMYVDAMTRIARS